MSVFENLISIVSPADCLVCGREGRALCEDCIDEQLSAFGERCAGCGILSQDCKTCSTCRARGLPSHVWVAVSYRGKAQQLIYKYKFDHQRHIAELCSDLMADCYTQYLPQRLVAKHTVVGIPTATKRVRERGFDHSILLATKVSRQLNLPRLNVLGRIGQSNQVGSSRAQRFQQASGKYYIRSADSVNGKHLLLVDDILTTGATLAEAANVMRKAGAASVDALVFAKKI